MVSLAAGERARIAALVYTCMFSCCRLGPAGCGWLANTHGLLAGWTLCVLEPFAQAYPFTPCQRVSRLSTSVLP